MTDRETHPLTLDLHELRIDATTSVYDAVGALHIFYNDLDQRAETLRRALTLPCGPGCGACCHEAVFITPLEWWGMVDYLQAHARWDLVQCAIERAAAIYHSQRAPLDALRAPPPADAADHWEIARDLHFPCPFLDDERCTVYPRRSLAARLFGISFWKPGEIYGCPVVESALANKEVRLLNAPAVIGRFSALPLTHGRMVIPYYVLRTYLPAAL
jgi:Fe-S-cluster containining protein